MTIELPPWPAGRTTLSLIEIGKIFEEARRDREGKIVEEAHRNDPGVEPLLPPSPVIEQRRANRERPLLSEEEFDRLEREALDRGNFDELLRLKTLRREQPDATVWEAVHSAYRAVEDLPKFMVKLASSLGVDLLHPRLGVPDGEAPDPTWHVGETGYRKIGKAILRRFGRCEDSPEQHTKPVSGCEQTEAAKNSGPRQRGRKPKQFPRVKDAMVADIRSGERDPRHMIEKQWATTYGASRDICRKALKAALSEIQAGNSDK